MTPKKALSVENLTEHIREHGANLASIARAFGVTRQAVSDYVSRYASLQRAVRDAKESVKDEAEDVLLVAMRKGDPWAVCFFLKTQAKDRGYIERQEIENREREKPWEETLTDEQLDKIIAEDNSRDDEGGKG